MITYPRGFKLSLFLFLFTFFNAAFFYTLHTHGHMPRTFAEFAKGFSFGVPLMMILLAHELGHYLTARIHGLEVSLPYFIPAPNFIGTMGALIFMRGRIPHRASIIETGAMGPIVGFLVAIPIHAYGLAHSQIIPLTSEGTRVQLGEPLISRILTNLIWGELPPSSDILLHPAAFAGWVGFLVTSLNMLPIGQLDGGHVVFGLFPRFHTFLSRLGIAALIVLGFVGWRGWALWAIFLVLVGYSHPQPLWHEPRLLGRTRVLGILALLIFVLTFMVKPFPL